MVNAYRLRGINGGLLPRLLPRLLSFSSSYIIISPLLTDIWVLSVDVVIEFAFHAASIGGVWGEVSERNAFFASVSYI